MLSSDPRRQEPQPPRLCRPPPPAYRLWQRGLLRIGLLFSLALFCCSRRSRYNGGFELGNLTGFVPATDASRSGVYNYSVLQAPHGWEDVSDSGASVHVVYGDKDPPAHCLTLPAKSQAPRSGFARPGRQSSYWRALLRLLPPAPLCIHSQAQARRGKLLRRTKGTSLWRSSTSASRASR